MRDPKRIDSILNQLREVWEKVPDWRLGQLIVNAVEPKEPNPEIFAVEDSRLQHLLARLSEQLSKRSAQDDTLS